MDTYSRQRRDRNVKLITGGWQQLDWFGQLQVLCMLFFKGKKHSLADCWLFARALWLQLIKL